MNGVAETKLASPHREGASVDSRYQKISVGALLLTAACAYIWALDRNGWANAYYSAAVQAGQHDLRSFLFASADWGNSITVDKPPLSLWVMGTAVHLFGLNSWSLMVPQALITLTSVFLTYRLMRRVFPFSPALLAAAAFAFTPITVLLARYNNPDPLMVLLMVASLYAGLWATESGQFRYLGLVALLLSLGFLTKQLQAFLVLPAIVITFLMCSRISWKTRAIYAFGMSALLAVGSLAWPVYVDTTPTADRPYVGGSTTNSMLELTLGYNGLNRVVQQGDAPSAALIPTEFRTVDTDAGLLRLFNSNYGQEIGWLLLPGLISAVAAICLLLRGRFNGKQKILVCAATTWMLTTYVVLSFMGNNFHSYYTASLALPMALCIGIGTNLIRGSLGSRTGRVTVVVTFIASLIFSRAMWNSSDIYPEWLATSVFFTGVCVTAALSLPAPNNAIPHHATLLLMALLLTGPILCSTLTVGSSEEGSNPLSGGVSVNPDTLSRFMEGVKRNDPAWAAGVAIGVKPTPDMTTLLQNAPRKCTWAAATYPGQTAAQFQLEADRPIMSIGGFAGVDPNPTLKEFQARVSAGEICYLVEQPEQLSVPGNSQELTAIQSWVRANFRAEHIDGVTVYTLS